MAILSGTIERTFIASINNEEIHLEDPNPNFSVEEIVEFYVPRYPQLLNSNIINRGIENDKATFEFKTVAGTKG